MSHDEQKGNRPGPAAMLAVLVSILLGASPAAAWSDVRPVGFNQAETAKSAALLRSLRRTSDDQALPSHPTLDSDGIPPGSETGFAPHRQPTAAVQPSADLFAGDRPAPFRARAPPAA